MAFGWFGVAVCLVLVECVHRRGYCFALALAALLPAYGLVWWPVLPMPYQFGLMGVAGSVACYAWWRYLCYHAPSYQQAGFDMDSRRYLKQTLTLTQPIVGGKGIIELDQQYWNLQAAKDINAGEQVVVYGVDGVVLRVK